MGELILEVLCYLTYEKSRALTQIILEVRHTSLTRREIHTTMFSAQPVGMLAGAWASGFP